MKWDLKRERRRKRGKSEEVGIKTGEGRERRWKIDKVGFKKGGGEGN
jgi:hypothetical protein